MRQPIHLLSNQRAEQGEADDIAPILEPYVLEVAGSPRGAVIVCPGGGYHHRAQHEGEPVAQWLNAIGIHAFVLHYRVAPHRHPVPLSDAQRAIRHVRFHAEEFGILPDKIGILGFSAGGHLAATAGTRYDGGNADSPDPIERVSSRPDAMVLCYPVISFGAFQHSGSVRNLLGDHPPESLIRSLSIETQITANTPPAFLWHTVDDASVPVENSLLLAGALSKLKVPFEMHLYPNGRHGLGLAGQDEQVGSWTRLCEVWLRKNGF